MTNCSSIHPLYYTPEAILYTESHVFQAFGTEQIYDIWINKSKINIGKFNPQTCYFWIKKKNNLNCFQRCVRGKKVNLCYLYNFKCYHQILWFSEGECRGSKREPPIAWGQKRSWNTWRIQYKKFQTWTLDFYISKSHNFSVKMMV